MDLPQHAVQRWRHGINEQRDHSFVIILLQIHLADIYALLAWAPSSYILFLPRDATLAIARCLYEDDVISDTDFACNRQT